MTSEGRLARGKANFERKRFLKNSETMAYAATLTKPTETKEYGKPKSRRTLST